MTSGSRHHLQIKRIYEAPGSNDGCRILIDRLWPRGLGKQQAALDAIDAAEGFRAYLLHGVTGSGKTEVYLRLVERALAAGQQALLLVPEINLTPQLESRVRARFPEIEVVSLHSELAEAARERAGTNCSPAVTWRK